MLTGDKPPALAASLDLHLLGAIKYLFDHWYEENTGIVACGLLDGEKIVFATSRKCQHAWLHAERNAYEKFKVLYGEPSKNSIFITTLSPCFRPLQHRVNASCVELMKSLGIQRVHFGVLDTFHLSFIADYSQMGLLASATQNPQLEAVCNNLLNIFDKYDSRINTDLLNVKKEMGSGLFSQALDIPDSNEADYERLFHLR